MKKKVFSIIGIAAFAVAVAVNMNVNINNSVEMDLALANVKALAKKAEVVLEKGCAHDPSGICVWWPEKVVVQGRPTS